MRKVTETTAGRWGEYVAAASLEHRPSRQLRGPVRLTITALMPRPLGHHVAGKRDRPLKSDAPRWHTSRPDRDNIDKSVMDALQTAGWFEVEDSQVCDGGCSKPYADPGQEVGVWIEIEELEP